MPGKRMGPPPRSFAADAHECIMVRVRDVPLFVEHCEAVATEIDVKLCWLGEQARRGLSFLSGALPGRHVALEVACEPSVVGSLWLLPAWRLRSSASPSRPSANVLRCGRRAAPCPSRSR